MRGSVAPAMIALAACVPQPGDLSLSSFRDMLEQTLRTNPEIVKDALTRAEVVEEARRHSETKRAASNLLKQARSGTSPMPTIGSASAETILVQVIDYRCPFCQLMHPEMTALLSQRPDVRVAFLVTSMLGEDSEALARFALAAEEQGRFEAVHNALLGAPEPVAASGDGLRNLAAKAGVDWQRAQRAMESEAVTQRLQSMEQRWEQLHRPGTPFTFFSDQIFAGVAKAEELARVLPKTASTTKYAD